MLVAVVADDLTGAADTGVQFVRAGYRTAVVFEGAALPGNETVDAVVVDTDSRAMPADDAARRVADAARAFREAGVTYKKVDSTLRGNVAAEVAAAFEASGRERIIFAPAFPAAGRTTVGGTQLVEGTPVHETGFAEDPVTPVREGHVPSLLSGEFPDVAVLGVPDLQDEPRARQALHDSRCVVADAESDEDLLALVRAVPDPERILWVGSAGLAGALGTIHRGPHAGEQPSPRPPVEGVLVVVGSLNAVSRDQLERLAQERGCTPLRVAGGPDSMEHAVKGARDELGNGGCAVLCSEEERGSPEGISRALSEVVSRLSDGGMFEALVLTGGDTAVRTARRMGAGGIRLEGEIEAGVVVGTLAGPRPYRVVTKAGGFGDEGTLARVVRQLIAGEG